MGSTSLVVPQESSLPIERCRRRLSRKRRFKEEWDLILGVFPRQLGQQDNSQEDKQEDEPGEPREHLSMAEFSESHQKHGLTDFKEVAFFVTVFF